MQSAIAKEILNGNLNMPNIPSLREIATKEQYLQVEKMFKALWHSYLLKGQGATISTPYWTKRIGSIKVVNIALKTLSINNWIISRSLPNNNWAEAYLNHEKLLEYVTEQQLAGVRKFNKFQKYLPNYNKSTTAHLTKLGSDKLDTGLRRSGFAKTGNTEYRFDINTLKVIKPEASELINKGIDKMIQKYPQITADLANYKEVGNEVIEALIHANEAYTGGPRTNDPRGRNNRGDLNKIGNPVGFKIMRALLVIPEHRCNKATEQGVINYYLFIAELNGFKNGTKEEKVAFGEECYSNYTYVKSSDLDDFYENVWLKRIYDELDTYFAKRLKSRISGTEITHYWSVPVEIDMSASVLGYIGLLLNHLPFMKRCNMVGDTLQDAWAHDVITNRKQFKTIMRQCYGSQQPADKMWDDMEIPYTHEEVIAFTKELMHGELAVANAFKDFIIGEANPKPEMVLHVRDEKVFVRCNKFFNVGEVTTKFDLYDTFTNSIRRIHHTDIKRIPDLKSFRRYFVTGLIHGLDGNVMNKVCSEVYDRYQWVIDIHDAMILCPEAANDARRLYANQLEDIHANRNTILENYFRSIGVKASAIHRWKSSVLPLVQPFEGKFKCNPMVLK